MERAGLSFDTKQGKLRANPASPLSIPNNFAILFPGVGVFQPLQYPAVAGKPRQTELADGCKKPSAFQRKQRLIAALFLHQRRPFVRRGIPAVKVLLRR